MDAWAAFSLFINVLLGGGALVAILKWHTDNRRSQVETGIMVKASELERLSSAFDTLLAQYQQLAERNDTLEKRIDALETERTALSAQAATSERRMQLQLAQAYERITALEEQVRELTASNTRLLAAAQRREKEHEKEIKVLRQQLATAVAGM